MNVVVGMILGVLAGWTISGLFIWVLGRRAMGSRRAVETLDKSYRAWQKVMTGRDER